MAEDVANLTYELLKRVNDRLGRVEDELRELRHRVAIVELHHTGIMASLQALNERLDRFDTRFSRIERRLDLVDTI